MMDVVTENLVKEQAEDIRRRKDRVAELEEVNMALLGELINKGMEPDYLAA